MCDECGIKIKDNYEECQFKIWDKIKSLCVTLPEEGQIILCDRCGNRIEDPEMNMTYITRDTNADAFDDKNALHFHDACWAIVWDELKSRYTMLSTGVPNV